MDKKPKGFRVVIEHPEKLFEQLKKPNELTSPSIFGEGGRQTEYELGGSPLDPPGGSLSVSARSGGDYYSLTAYIGRGEILDRSPLPISIEQLEKEFQIKKIGRAVYILDSDQQEEFVVHASISVGSLYVTAGADGRLDNFSTPAKQISNLEKFEADMGKFAKVLETVVNGIYFESKKVAPDFTLKLRPQLTKVNEESLSFTKFGDVRKDTLLKAIEIEKPNLSFADIGGQEEAKREIQGISFALKNPGLYQKWGTAPPKGVMLVGPPGTGKTLMAKALASEAQAKFFHVKASDVVSMWYGQSEKIMQAVFDLAREEEGPSIIFFDEIDALASNRDNSHEATSRIVSTMLENLDGLESSSNTIVVASTNRPDVVDPAIKRPGRIDRIVEVGLPNDEGRRQILQIHFGKAEKMAERSLLNDVDFKKVLEATDKMSGADIAELVRRVLEEKVRQEGTGETANLVTTEDILWQIKSYERNQLKQRGLGFQPKD